MLKKYLQALLEAFIGSKGQKIAELISPNFGRKVRIAVEFEKETSYVPVEEGYLYIESEKATWLRVGNGSIEAIKNTAAWDFTWIRVNKGVKLTLSANQAGYEPNVGKVYFIPLHT